MNSIGFEEILIGGAVLLLLALLASFWAAWRGHWSAPVMAVAGLIAGLPVLLVCFGPHTDLPVKAIGSIPTLLGIGSLVLWSRKHQAKKYANESRSSGSPSGGET